MKIEELRELLSSKYENLGIALQKTPWYSYEEGLEELLDLINSETNSDLFTWLRVSHPRITGEYLRHRKKVDKMNKERGGKKSEN